MMTKEPNAQPPVEELSTLGNFVLAVAQTLEELGFDSESVFTAAKLDGDRKALKQSRVAISQLAKVWRTGVEITSNDALGIEVAQRIRPSTLDALSMSLFACETLMSALNRLARYHCMISDGLEMQIEIDNSSVTLVIESFVPQRAIEGMDCALATPLHCCREISREDIIPDKVCFTRPPPENIEAFQRFFRCPMEFSAEGNSLSLPNEVLDRELPGSNVEVSNHLEDLIGKYMTGRNQSETINRAYVFITKHLSSGSVSEELMADHFNCSTRQLQRKLKDDGTSFRALLDRIRMDLAEQYIKVNQFSITETAYLLGYSNPNNFSRAFKKWTGVGPVEFYNRLSRLDSRSHK